MGRRQQVRIRPGTLAHWAYRRHVVTERFRCRYGLNPIYGDQISRSRLTIAGIDSEGEVRIVELSDHRFFLAALFLPQLSSSSEAPHPMITAYLEVVRAFVAARPAGVSP